MTNWMSWMVLAAMMVILEMFLGTFYLLMVAIGMVVGAICAFLGLALEWQILLAALAGALATLGLRRHRFAAVPKAPASADPNVNLDIGQVIVVDHWLGNQGSSTARVMHRGALWDVDLAPGQVAIAGRFVIREVRGSRFLVVSA
ncbi:MAG: NfeD family protein [Janthinobacterium lividum]